MLWRFCATGKVLLSKWTSYVSCGLCGHAIHKFIIGFIRPFDVLDVLWLCFCAIPFMRFRMNMRRSSGACVVDAFCLSLHYSPRIWRSGMLEWGEACIACRCTHVSVLHFCHQASTTTYTRYNDIHQHWQRLDNNVCSTHAKRTADWTQYIHSSYISWTLSSSWWGMWGMLWRIHSYYIVRVWPDLQQRCMFVVLIMIHHQSQSTPRQLHRMVLDYCASRWAMSMCIVQVTWSASLSAPVVSTASNNDVKWNWHSAIAIVFAYSYSHCPPPLMACISPRPRTVHVESRVSTKCAMRNSSLALDAFEKRQNKTGTHQIHCHVLRIEFDGRRLLWRRFDAIVCVCVCWIE